MFTKALLRSGLQTYALLMVWSTVAASEKNLSLKAYACFGVCVSKCLQSPLLDNSAAARTSKSCSKECSRFNRRSICESKKCWNECQNLGQYGFSNITVAAVNISYAEFTPMIVNVRWTFTGQNVVFVLAWRDEEDPTDDWTLAAQATSETSATFQKPSLCSVLQVRVLPVALSDGTVGIWSRATSLFKPRPLVPPGKGRLKVVALVNTTNGILATFEFGLPPGWNSSDVTIVDFVSLISSCAYRGRGIVPTSVRIPGKPQVQYLFTNIDISQRQPCKWLWLLRISFDEKVKEVWSTCNTTERYPSIDSRDPPDFAYLPFNLSCSNIANVACPASSYCNDIAAECSPDVIALNASVDPESSSCDSTHLRISWMAPAEAARCPVDHYELHWASPYSDARSSNAAHRNLTAAEIDFLPRGKELGNATLNADTFFLGLPFLEPGPGYFVVACAVYVPVDVIRAREADGRVLPWRDKMARYVDAPHDICLPTTNYVYVNADKNEPVILTCSIRRSSRSNVEWLVNGNALIIANTSSIHQHHDQSGTKFSASSDGSELTIYNAVNVIDETYSCHVVEPGHVSMEMQSFRFRLLIAPHETASAWKIAVAVAAAIAFCLLTAFFLIRVAMKRRFRKIRAAMFKQMEFFLQGTDFEMQHIDTDASVRDIIQHLPYDKSRFEIAKDRLKLGRKLGEGEYGVVLCGSLRNNEDVVEVAVKHPLSYSEAEHYEALIAELKIMLHAGTHQNLIQFYGAVTENLFRGELYLIMELCICSLYEFLRKDDAAEAIDISLSSQLCISLGIAEGMAYLVSRGIVHRDLAARNVLLDVELVPKIADYGLARTLTSGYYRVRKSHNAALPFAWMAYELLDFSPSQRISEKSDVWSFGVVLWEIFSLGQQPYNSLFTFDDDNAVATLRTYLKRGHRLERPEACCTRTYELMISCWNADLKQRPTFLECIERIEELLHADSDQLCTTEL